jgi:hypothetical protein
MQAERQQIPSQSHRAKLNRFAADELQGEGSA